jgi:hypothetical protein
MTDQRSTRRLSRRRALALGGVGLSGLAFGSSTVFGASDHDEGDSAAREYRVTVANNTRGQPFTPPAVAVHRPSVEVFSVGDDVNEPTEEVAENGNLGPLVDLIQSTNAIRGSAVGGSPLVPEDDPGDTDLPYYAELTVGADASATHMTFLSMLIATNDGIVGLDTVELPGEVNESQTIYANGYDVGSEENTELFEDMVPAAQSLIIGGEPEGTTQSDSSLQEDKPIRPHPGIQGVGNLPPEVYDWREPAALVQVERVK